MSHDSGTQFDQIEALKSKLAALRTRAEEAERKLAEARAEWMEEAAKVCDRIAHPMARCCADTIRAKMKEQK